MKIELRPTRDRWMWIIREGNVTSVSGRHFASIDEALRDACSDCERDPDGDEPPPLVA
jgi:hypothetical protein